MELPSHGATDQQESLRSLLQLKKKYDQPSAEEVPESYKVNNEKERLYLWSAGNFCRQVRVRHPRLRPLCLTLRNEHGAHKLAPTFLRPTALPFSHLCHVQRCAQFVSDYVFYTPMAEEGNPPDAVASPTKTLASQMGNSLEMSLVLVSLLSGYGFQAYVVCGWATRAVATMDRSNAVHLLHGEAPETTKEEIGSSVNKYEVDAPPELTSKYLAFIENNNLENGGESSVQENDDVDQIRSGGNGADAETSGQAEEDVNADSEKKAQESPADRDTGGSGGLRFHSWVYVQMSGAAFFLEPSTGERRPLDSDDYGDINCVFSHNNYWLSRAGERREGEGGPEGGREDRRWWQAAPSLDLSNNDLWVKLVADFVDDNKRLLVPLYSWVEELKVPADCYELMYRLGQKTERYRNGRVEYFAPYLMKEGTVQKVMHFQHIGDGDESVADGKDPPVSHVIEKFRHRKDRMVERETFPQSNCVVERFAPGRADRLREHKYVRLSGSHPIEYECRFYSEARGDGLAERSIREMEMIEHYADSRQADRLKSMHVTFMVGEKKFGPAENSSRGQKEIAKIVERYRERELRAGRGEGDGRRGEEEEREECEGEEASSSPAGRVLDTSRVMERVFDVDGERILLKFERERGQIFCKTVEFLPPKATPEDEGEPEMTADDFKVFLVDPREERPTQRELEIVYEEQVRRQNHAVAAVLRIEKEMDRLLETRMKELSSNELDVWLYDVKRNPSVRRGRQELEAAARRRTESVKNLDIDFLAPFLQRCADHAKATHDSKLMQDMKETALSELRRDQETKVSDLREALRVVEEELARGIPDEAERNTKKFYCRLLQVRFERQRHHAEELVRKAEMQWSSDQRIKNLKIV